MTTDIGLYTVGEKPAPLVYSFLDASGVAINITGYAARFQWGLKDGSGLAINPATEIATVTDAVNGKVTYTWDGDEFLTPGTYIGMFWVGNGANRFASVQLEWTTCQSVGPAPAI